MDDFRFYFNVKGSVLKTESNQLEYTLNHAIGMNCVYACLGNVISVRHLQEWSR